MIPFGRPWNAPDRPVRAVSLVPHIEDRRAAGLDGDDLVAAAAPGQDLAGEEVIAVLSGKIDLHREKTEPVRLGVGDSACFESGRRHCFVCVSEQHAPILSDFTRAPATRTGGRLTSS